MKNIFVQTAICILLIQYVTCSFIILNFKDEIDQRKTSFCALKKSNNEDDDNFVVYRLVDILGRNSSINICKGVNYNINMNFSSNSTSKYEFAAYFEMDINFDRPCSFQSLINGVTPNNTALRLRVVIIGTNGPVKANSKVNVSAVFLPKISSKDLRKFLNLSYHIKNVTTKETTSIVSVYLEKYSLYDHSLIVIWILAFIVVFSGALWTKQNYIIMLYKRTKIIAREKKSETQYFDNPTLKKKEISTEEHLGNYYKYNDILPTDLTEQMKDDKNIRTRVNETSGKETKKETKKNKVYYFLFEKDDGEYDETEYDDMISPTFDFEELVCALVLLGFWVFLTVAFLLLLFFFYDVLIYFIYVKFVLASAYAMYTIICIGVDKINFLTCRIRRNKIPLLKSRPQVRKIVIRLVCLTVSIIWFVYRDKNWIWALQDIMSISLSIFALSIIRITAFKHMTFILIAFFLYDVFMVFITPFFTGGSSIMEAVVNGGKVVSENDIWNGLQFDVQYYINRIPIIISIPNLSENRKLCDSLRYPFTSLGLGDLIIPGLCINFAIIYDLAASNSYYIYFIVNLISYMLGLFLAFIGFIFMNSSQPALFYICPLLIIVNVVTALIRKELRLIWSGDMVKKFRDLNSGDYRNLSNYKVTKRNTFNILKITRSERRKHESKTNDESDDKYEPKF